MRRRRITVLKELVPWCWGCEINVVGGYAEREDQHDRALHEAVDRIVAKARPPYVMPPHDPDRDENAW